MRIQSRFSCTQGTAVTEFAICVPVIFFLLICTFEVGRAINKYCVLNQVAYEAVRFGISQPGLAHENADPNDQIATRVKELLSKSDTKYDNITVDFVEEAGAPSRVIVRLEAEYDSFFTNPSVNPFAYAKIRVTKAGNYLYAPVESEPAATGLTIASVNG